MILPIYVYGSNVLRRKADKVDKDMSNLQQLIADMFETMYYADGVGLAAPQIGHSLRLFVVDASAMEEDDPIAKDFKKVFINPEILERFGEKELFREGCLSLPELREDVLRETKIRIRYQDEKFQLHEEVIEGIPARIIQHEYDHIDGILFSDHLSLLRKKLIKKRLKNISEGKVATSYKTKIG